MNWKFEGLVSNYQTWTLRNKNGGVLFTVYQRAKHDWDMYNLQGIRVVALRWAGSYPLDELMRRAEKLL